LSRIPFAEKACHFLHFLPRGFSANCKLGVKFKSGQVCSFVKQVSGENTYIAYKNTKCAVKIRLTFALLSVVYFLYFPVGKGGEARENKQHQKLFFLGTHKNK
jgi:hypothetical protein